MKKLFFTLILIIAFINANAQEKYVIFLKDKNNNPYSINNPIQFLSQKAIDRRTRQGIAITEQDLPVTPSYLTGIANAGATIICKSKWLNSVTVEADTTEMIAIGALTYVDSYKEVYGANLTKPAGESKFSKTEKLPAEKNATNSSTDYGFADTHIKLINGKPLHNMGFKGQGVLVAVLDAGFPSVDNHFVFDSLRTDSRIKGTYDFVFNDPYVYHESSHGTAVLSLMAANVPGEFVGTAPQADYVLIHTEDDRNGTEYIIEEYNWASGAEYADSIGADVINSSLGYTTFLAASQDHSYADMNGSTAPITIVADIAYSKGILVVNSAGNSGWSSWFYIGAPADGFNVMSIGATDSSGNISGYSSHGPTSDGRIKPNVSGQGTDCIFADPSGGYGAGSGTSFSGPIIAGMSACLWQAFPNKTNGEIKSAIEQSADRYNNPDNDYGYGIPDFEVAYQILLNSGIPSHSNAQRLLKIKSNPFDNELRFDYFSGSEKEITVKVSDIMGRKLIEKRYPVDPNSNNSFSMNSELSFIIKGIYILSITSEKNSIAEKILKN